MEVSFIFEFACCPLLASMPRLVSTSTAFVSTPHLWSTWDHRKECWKCSGHLITCISLRLSRGNRLISPPTPGSHWRLPTITESHFTFLLRETSPSPPSQLPHGSGTHLCKLVPHQGLVLLMCWTVKGIFLLDVVAMVSMPNWWVSVAMNGLRKDHVFFFFFSPICEQVWFYTLLSPCVRFLETRESCDRRRRR